MKRFSVILISISFAYSLFAQDTLIYQASVMLNSSWSAFENVDVVATDGISLNAGFEYSSNGVGEFFAVGDPYYIEPPSGFAPFAGNNYDSTGNASFSYSKVVGSIAGSAGVSASGAATYTIPIAVPSGINGIEPQLSVTYNSQGQSHGILGQDWHLNGISSIQVTGRDMYHDGIKGSISSVDSQCMLVWDGQRLYGINGTGLEADSFKTEFSSSHRILKHSLPGKYFTIESEDGMTLIYGKSENARLHLSSTIEWKWLLEKAYDRNGNVILYSYIVDAAKKQIVLENIRYGSISGTDTLIVGEVDFEYSTRPQIRYANIVGFNTIYDKQLDRISLKSNGDFVGAYDFHYFQQGNVYLLDYIIQSDENGFEMNPIIINWDIPELDFTFSPDTVSIQHGDNYKYFTGDYNGDGFSDLLSVELDHDSYAYNYYMYYGASTGLPSSPNETGSLPRSYTAQFWPQLSNYYNQNCDTLDGSAVTSYNYDDVSYVISGDFDGDGIDELMVKVYEWPVLAATLPADINSGFEAGYPNSGLYGIDICSQEDALVNLQLNMEPIYGLGRFIHFDENANAQERITTIRLGEEIESMAIDSKYPDLFGLGYALIPDDQKVKYYDIKNDTAFALCDYQGGDIWGEFNGDGYADYITTGSGSLSINLFSQNDSSFFTPQTINNILLGTIDVNGDHTDGIVHIEPYSFTSISYMVLWEYYCGGNCDMDDDDVWNTFLAIFELEDEFETYNCNGAPPDICKTAFLLNGTYNNIQEVAIKIEHLDGHGPTINLGSVLSTPRSIITHALSADLNADGFEELLLFNYTRLKKIYYDFTPRYVNNTIEYTYSEYSPNINLDESTRIGDFNGDGIMEFVSPETNRLIKFNVTDQAGYQVSGIVDGMNRESRFHYSYLTDEQVYTQYDDAEYPVIDFTAPWQVVTSMASDNGVALPDSSSFSYQGAKIHLKGQGFLGFMKNTVHNHLDNTEKENTNRLDTTYYISLPAVSILKADGDIIARTDYYSKIVEESLADHKILNMQSDSLKASDFLNNITSTTSFTYNSYGQLSEKRSQTGPDFTLISRQTYQSGGWHYPYLPQSQSQSYYSGGDCITDSSRYTVNNGGQITSVKQFCGTDKEVVTVLSGYNSYGKPERISKSGQFSNTQIDSIFAEFEYSSSARFLNSINGPLDQKMYFEYDECAGELLSQRSINGLESTFAYGPFGITEIQRSPTGLQSTSRTFWAEGHPDAPDGAFFYTWTKSSGQSESYTFFDAAGRPLRQVTFGYNNEKIFTDSEYLTNGMLYRSSLPYEENETPLWSTFSYDDLGRISEQLSADTVLTEYEYAARWQKVTISKGSLTRSSEVYSNELGQSIQSIDADGNSVFRSYYPNGLLKESYTSVHPSKKISLAYDVHGNRVMLDDPDAGRDTAVYDDFGQLLWTVNAKGDTTTFLYDKLGRVIQSTDMRGDINYAYITDTTSKAFGKIDSIYSSDGTLSESFTYSSDYGRLMSSSRRIPASTGEADKRFTDSYTYDWFGRPMTRTYPSGFELQYAYSDNGYLEEIRGNGQSIWACSDINELGQITSYSQGAYSTSIDYNAFGELEEISTGNVFNMKFAFDDLGNLTSREDVLTSQKEIFEYDELNRLTNIDYYLNGTHMSGADMEIGYGDDGNILSKSDVSDVINYGEGTAGPHALTSIEEPLNDFRPPPQTISYTCFNKVHTISDTIGRDTTLTLSFSYGLGNQRTRMEQRRNGSVERIKYYNGDYEEDSTASGTKKYHYISAPNGLTAIFVMEGSADTLYHVLTDHLGSLNGVINAENDSVTYFSYNAWGIPRDPDDWTSGFDGELFAGRGYTGHEHLQEFSLINMNGRVYDPVLARFLSPDPFVQFTGTASGYNRYAYVMNNPLRFTDPSGYISAEEALKRLWNSSNGGYWNNGDSDVSYYTFAQAQAGLAAFFTLYDAGAFSGGGSSSGTIKQINRYHLNIKGGLSILPNNVWHGREGRLLGWSSLGISLTRSSSWEWVSTGASDIPGDSFGDFWEGSDGVFMGEGGPGGRGKLVCGDWDSTLKWIKKLYREGTDNPTTGNSYNLADIVDWDSWPKVRTHSIFKDNSTAGTDMVTFHNKTMDIYFSYPKQLYNNGMYLKNNYLDGISFRIESKAKIYQIHVYNTEIQYGVINFRTYNFDSFKWLYKEITNKDFVYHEVFEYTWYDL